MVMPKQRSDSELLREGCRSYHKVLAAVRQFRQEVQEAIRAAVEERLADIAAELKLDKAEISEGLTPYSDPASAGQGWDGSTASVGLKYPGGDWEAKWGIYFYFWIGEGEEGCARAYCWIKEPGPAMRKLASLGIEVLETSRSSAWISETITDADGFTGAMGRVLDIWIEVWRKAGGIRQFLPPRAVRDPQAGK